VLQLSSALLMSLMVEFWLLQKGKEMQQQARFMHALGGRSMVLHMSVQAQLVTHGNQNIFPFCLSSMRIARNLITNTSTESSECTESLHSNYKSLIFWSRFAGLCARRNFQLARSYLST
jgi:hypothetical protein